jgi:hypothetical protein
MKLAIMQPYFFPYIGYFQLINSVDQFVIYDNIEFTKKGWINRNRILVNGVDTYISLPMKKDSDFLHVNNRFLADSWDFERKKMINRIIESYRKAPFFEETFEVIERCIMFEDRNLFNFIFHSISILVDHLRIDTGLIISSNIPIDHKLKSEEKVISICKEMNAEVYINSIGGVNLYDQTHFRMKDIELLFLQSNELIYRQYQNDFIPWLSIIDVMMFNPKTVIEDYLLCCTLINSKI